MIIVVDDESHLREFEWRHRMQTDQFISATNPGSQSPRDESSENNEHSADHGCLRRRGFRDPFDPTDFRSEPAIPEEDFSVTNFPPEEKEQLETLRADADF
jgi:hypothetical protein